MAEHAWIEEFPASISVCDANGIIIAMNAHVAKAFEKQGGNKLIGTNLMDCHPEPARTRLKKLMESRQTNTYTTERNGVKKLVHQAPWTQNGQYAGYVEIIIELPQTMPHFKRG
jgi:transcriptional regulator with PAS, ATPase and Fis domain